MKVQEAKEKHCPFINSNCLTGKCMAWVYTKKQEETEIISLNRESYEEHKIKDKKLTDKHIKVDSYSYGDYLEYTDERWAIMKDLSEDEKEGYCIKL